MSCSADSSSLLLFVNLKVYNIFFLLQRTASKSPLRQTQVITGQEGPPPPTRMATRSSPRKNAQGPVPSTSQGKILFQLNRGLERLEPC